MLIAYGLWSLASIPRPQEKSHLASGYATRSLSKEFSCGHIVSAAGLAFPYGDLEGV